MPEGIETGICGRLADGLLRVRAIAASVSRRKTRESAGSAQSRGTALASRLCERRMLPIRVHQELSNRINRRCSCIGSRLGPLIIRPRCHVQSIGWLRPAESPIAFQGDCRKAGINNRPELSNNITLCEEMERAVPVHVTHRRV